jgi:DNA polymerase-1
MHDDFDPTTVSWVLTVDDLAHLLGAIQACDEVVIDLETTGLDEHAVLNGKTNGGYPARIVLASLTLPTSVHRNGTPTTWVVPLSHPESPWLGRWRTVLRKIALTVLEADKPVVNQNVKFDARWVQAQCGADLSHQLTWDTMVSSHMLDENASTRLKERAPATFGVRRWDDFDLTTPGAAERVPMFDLGLYAARDTYWTWRLADLHREEMYLAPDHEEPDGPDEIANARLGKLAVWCAAAVLHLELAQRYSGLNPNDASFAPTSLWFADWAAFAVNAGDLVVAELTPTGKARWSKGVLVRQARKGSDVAQALLDLRGHTKKAEFLQSWLNCRSPEDVIHSTYWPGRVVTGRLSSTDPNMQQVTAALKPAFVPSPGYVFADLDYGQIELRVAAFISRCMPMIEAFRRGDDLHSLLAARITGKKVADVLPSERQAGKSANFGLLYKMSAYGFQMYAETVYGVSFTIEEAQLIHRTFFETWDGIAQWHARSIARAQRTGYVVSPIGRIRRLPDIWDANESLAAFAERNSINSPVQGFASDLMQMAAASIEGMLPGSSPVVGARLVGTVHDSILAEVREDDWKEIALECQQRMLSVPLLLRKLDCDFDVPLTADVKVGTRWGLSDIGLLH